MYFWTRCHCANCCYSQSATTKRSFGTGGECTEENLCPRDGGAGGIESEGPANSSPGEYRYHKLDDAIPANAFSRLCTGEQAGLKYVFGIL